MSAPNLSGPHTHTVHACHKQRWRTSVSCTYRFLTSSCTTALVAARVPTFARITKQCRPIFRVAIWGGMAEPDHERLGCRFLNVFFSPSLWQTRLHPIRTGPLAPSFAPYCAGKSIHARRGREARSSCRRRTRERSPSKRPSHAWSESGEMAGMRCRGRDWPISIAPTDLLLAASNLENGC